MKNFSRKREAIYRVLCQTKSHPTADWVYDQLKPELPDLSLATVYRNLSEFVQEGKAVRLCVVDGHERFDGCTAPHAHFVCDKCGKVFDLDCSVPEDWAQEVETATGARIDRHELFFHGSCPDCV